MPSGVEFDDVVGGSIVVSDRIDAKISRTSEAVYFESIESRVMFYSSSYAICDLREQSRARL